jgi:beta-glucanase (GH16 family)
VSGGALVMTAKRQSVTSPMLGRKYDWTSCLLTTRKSYAFQYGYIEERSILPAAKGFWPAFWTWQVKGADQQTETDVYEYYSDNHRRLYGTQYSGAQGRCEYGPPFDPSDGWHTYGVSVLPTGTTWYTDGVQVCHVAATSNGLSNIITNLAVYAKIPPDPGTTSATKRVDYIRAWKAS